MQEKPYVTEEEARKIAEQVYLQKATRFGVATVPFHVHNGIDANQISQSDVIPQLRAGANITMATDGRTYKLGLTFNPVSVQFIGIAYHDSGGGKDIRAHVIGNAQLGPTYPFVDDGSGNTVVPGPIGNLIQFSSSLTIASALSGGAVSSAIITSESNIIYVVAPGGTQVAVGTITGYSSKYISVHVTLAADWTIQGNFVVT